MLKTAENWMRRGRVVQPGEQPLKYVKQRAVTLNRRRELEVRADAEGANGGSSGGGVMQGLYAERQTERYIPPPVIDVRSTVHSSPSHGGFFVRLGAHHAENAGKDSEERLWEH